MKYVNMNVMSVRNTYSPKLRHLPSLVFTIRDLRRSWSGSSQRSWVHPPLHERLQTPRCAHEPRSQKHNIFFCCYNQKEQEQANTCAQYVDYQIEVHT